MTLVRRGRTATLGPGFPIAEAPPRPVSELYLQAAIAATDGAALILAGVGSRFEPLVKRCLISAPDRIRFVLLYAAVTSSGIAVLTGRSDA